MKYALFIIGLLLIAGCASTAQPNVPPKSSGEPQLVTLSFVKGNYYPQTITVKAGQAVRISLDASVRGCYRTFVVSAFKVQRNLATPSDYVEFTPTQPGTYAFACGMGMGTGKLIVQ